MVIGGKMFLGQAGAAFGIIQRENTIFRMLTFITLTKRIFKVLSGYAVTVQYCLAQLPPLSCLVAIDPATEWPFSGYRSSNWLRDHVHQSDTVLIFSNIGGMRRIVVE